MVAERAKTPVILILIDLAGIGAVIGFIIGHGVLFGKVKDTFGLVGAADDPTGDYDNSCEAIKTSALAGTIAGILAPGLGGMIPACIIIDRTYAADCAQNKAAFIHAVEVSSKLRDVWYGKLRANAVDPEGNWSESDFFQDWAWARCEHPHIMNIVLVAVFVVCGMIGPCVTCFFCLRKVTDESPLN
jgi:hypothetical protein